MTRSRTAELLAILQSCFNPREEGWLWLALYGDYQDTGVVQEFTGEYDDPEVTAHGLSRLIEAVAADRAYLALCRGDGRPTERDREMWRVLRRMVTPEALEDLVVFNRREAWSMRAEDAA